MLAHSHVEASHSKSTLIVIDWTALSFLLEMIAA